MAMKAIEIDGPAAVVRRPLRLRRYDAAQLPDPGECVDSLIAVNDRTRTGSVSLRFSDGSTWLDCSAVAVLPAATQQQTVDVTPLVRAAVRDMLPALVPAAPMPALPPPVQVAPVVDPDRAAMATALLELGQHVGDLQRRLHEAEIRIDQLERTALAEVKITRTAR